MEKRKCLVRRHPSAATVQKITESHAVALDLKFARTAAMFAVKRVSLMFIQT